MSCNETIVERLFADLGMKKVITAITLFFVLIRTCVIHLLSG